MLRKSKAVDTSSTTNGSGTFAEIEPKLRPSDLYELEWIELYTELVNDDLKELRRTAIQKGFRAKKFRSIYWALLLEVLGKDPYHWLNERRTARNQYDVMREQFNRNPYQSQSSSSEQKQDNSQGDIKQQSLEKSFIEKSLVSDDPLSQSDQSIWHQHFCDQELTKLISQDVQRTFPGVDFFRQSEMQTHMANILFAYARANPHICYRQGMHELLAPLLFVMHADHQYLLEIKLITNCVNPTMFEMLDPSYLEADTYGLFTKLMARMETYYRIKNVVPNASGELPRVNSMDPKCTTSPNPVDELDMHIRWMRANVLARYDPEVDTHLTRLNIPLSVIGIRWYRLLFGREVSFGDLLTLWDAIFANHFQLVKYFPAAMLISVREKLLTSDFVGAYECLMGFQDSVDVRRLIKYSMYLQDPQKYKRPDGVFVPVHPKNIRKEQPKPVIARSDTLPSRPAPKRSPRAQEMLRPRANSLKQRIPAVNTSMATGNNHELGVSEGYFEDDPAVLKMNVEYMVKVMAISRLKLQQYVNGLRDSVAMNNTREISNCLDGLEELCAFMEPRHQSMGGLNNGQRNDSLASPIYMSPPVERAYAADELVNGTILGTPKMGMSTPNSSPVLIDGTQAGPSRRVINGRESKLAVNHNPEVVNDEKKLIKTGCDVSPPGDDGFVVVEEENATESQTMLMTASILNELSKSASTMHGSGSLNGGSFRSSYEWPEHKIPHEAQKVIGNRKEVELVEMVKGNGGEPSQGQEQGFTWGSDFVPSTDPHGERRVSK